MLLIMLNKLINKLREAKTEQDEKRAKREHITKLKEERGKKQNWKK